MGNSPIKGLVTTILSVCPIRSKPDDAAEMVSQILFGETAVILEKGKRDWVRIQLTYDGYVGWIDKKQLVPSHRNSDVEVSYNLEIFENIFCDALSTWITLGAELPSYDGMTTSVSKNKFRYSGQAVSSSMIVPTGEKIEKLARKLLNSPYLWGGRTPMGIDCSGLSQIVFKCVGLKIPRDAKDQAQKGSMVDFVSSGKLGDLAFFTKATDRISHVGIVLNDGMIIHAAGKVRIDRLDHYGIFNPEIQEYTHRLKIIKRYF